MDLITIPTLAPYTPDNVPPLSTKLYPTLRPLMAFIGELTFMTAKQLYGNQIFRMTDKESGLRPNMPRCEAWMP